MPRASLLLLVSIVALSAESVDEIVARNLAARGGVEKLLAVHSQRLTGAISFGPGNGGPFQVEMKRPGKMRETLTLGGKTIIRTTNGTAGWIVNGDADPAPLSSAILKNMAGGADFDGPLMDYRAKGNRIELAGKEAIGGKNTYKLIVTMNDGQVRSDFIDCESYLEIKWEGKLTFDGKESSVESFFRDYRKVDGIAYAFAIDSDTVGVPGKQELRFEKIEVNPREDDARFEKPAR
jgi:hypothetical protein